jgi:hypothetical protein
MQSALSKETAYDNFSKKAIAWWGQTVPQCSTKGLPGYVMLKGMVRHLLVCGSSVQCDP